MPTWAEIESWLYAQPEWMDPMTIGRLMEQARHFHDKKAGPTITPDMLKEAGRWKQ